jgi:hypothetical protein
MAIITIRTPPDGNDVTAGFVTRFQAVMPQGLTVKEILIALAKQEVRRREDLANLRTGQTALFSNIAAKRAALANDPDVGGSDLP